MLKRIFDLFFSFIGIFFLSPLIILIGILIKLTSKGPVLFLQARVGKNGEEFKIFKFRTMIVDAEKKGLQLTVGMKDPRITRIGHYLRKFKLDELPQLFNVFLGDMSLVGPRPEVPKYVSMYTREQRRVLEVRPGITDMASIEYFDENKLLAGQENPEKIYTEEIMPAKLAINLKYLEQRSLTKDFFVILKTLAKLA